MPEGPVREPLVQGRYTWVFDDGSTFSDAIVLPKSEYEALPEAQLQAMKQARAEEWKARVEASQNYRPTEEELRAERRERKLALEAQRDQIATDLARINAEIAAER